MIAVALNNMNPRYFRVRAGGVGFSETLVTIVLTMLKEP